MSATLRRGATNLPVRPLAMWAPYRYGVFSWLQQTDEQIADTIAFLRGEILKGVTDGSEARPGEVGEYYQASPVIDITASPTTFNAGILPPGDWDVWAVSSFSEPIQNAYWHMVPQPPGFALNLYAGELGATSPIVNELLSNMARCLTAAPALLSWEVWANEGLALPAGLQMNFNVMARRMR